MSSSTPNDPLIGGEFGGYQVESLLGEGGMGKVYLATGQDQNRVALKLVKQDYARDETFRRRFSREARIAQTVKHPNVVPVVAVGEQDGIPYMAQRFIDGESLGDKLKREGQLNIPTAVRICADVAAGLEALWATGMVHRDVKPANILLSAEDGQGYITDFGLAKDTQGSILTLPGQALGSMDYMAPEQIRGEEVSAATDIYALGCVMYESLTGRPPFADVQGMRILWAQLQDEPKNPRELRPELPEEFVRAMMVALQKERDKRPARAGEYAEMLAAAAGSAATPSSAPAPEPPAPAPGEGIRSSETRISDAASLGDEES
jgi:serine/threonine-protein kinase